MKTTHIGKRIFAAFFALAFLLTLLPVTAMPAKADGTAREFVLATELKDGRQYLISDTKMEPMNTDPDTGEVTWPASMDAHIMGWGIQGTDQRVLTSETVTVTDGHISIDPSNYTTYLWKVERNTDNNAFGLFSEGYYVTGNRITDDGTNAKYWTYSNNNLRFSGTFTIRYDANSGNFVRFQDNNPTPVYFYEPVYSIRNTTSSATHGHITISKNADIREGDSITITANPYTDCRLESLYVDGSDVKGDVENNQYTFEYTFGRDIEVSAVFLYIPYYSITVPGSTGGSVVAKVGGIPVARAEQNDTVTLDVTEDPGYQLSRLYYKIRDGVDEEHPISGDSFTMPQGHITVYAEFVKDLPFTPATSIDQNAKYMLVTQMPDGTLYALKKNGTSIGKENVTGKLSPFDNVIYNENLVWNVTGTDLGFKISSNSSSSYSVSINYNGSLSLQGTLDTWQLAGDNGLQNTDGRYLIYDANSSNTFDIWYYVDPTSDYYRPVYLYKIPPRFTGRYIKLSDSINLVLVMDLSSLGDTQSIMQDGSWSMSYQIGGEHKPIIGLDRSNLTFREDGKAEFSIPVTSLQMADDITAIFRYNGGQDTVRYTTSVEEYIDALIGSTSDTITANDKNIARALGDYGHYAQIYLGDIHGFTVGDGTTDKYKEMPPYSDGNPHYTGGVFDHTAAITGLTDELFRPAFEDRGSTVNKISIQLSLEGKTLLRIGAKDADGNVVKDVVGTAVFLSNDVPAKTVQFQNGVAIIPDIKPSQLAYPVKIDGRTGVQNADFSATVSPLSYAYLVLKNSESTDKNKDLAAALYYYAEACGALN